MFGGLFIISLIGLLVRLIKESCQSVVSTETSANKTTYPEPHRDSMSGKIIIENCSLYKADVNNYGAYQAQQWVKQSKYNLTSDELRKEYARIAKHYNLSYALA